jgi:hypothetical protein
MTITPSLFQLQIDSNIPANIIACRCTVNDLPSRPSFWVCVCCSAMQDAMRPEQSVLEPAATVPTLRAQTPPRTLPARESHAQLCSALGLCQILLGITAAFAVLH